MADLRKEVAEAITGHDLSTEDLFESALDHIYAFAYGDPLGIALWRLKWAADAGQHGRAVRELARRIRRRGEPFEMLNRVAQVAIREWLCDVCNVCSGRGRVVVEGTPTGGGECPKCGGAGRIRMSDDERMLHASMRPEIYRKHERLFARARNKIDAADFETWRRMFAHLEGVDAGGELQSRLDSIYTRRHTSQVASPPHNENDMAEGASRSETGTVGTVTSIENAPPGYTRDAEGLSQ